MTFHNTAWLYYGFRYYMPAEERWPKWYPAGKKVSLYGFDRNGGIDSNNYSSKREMKFVFIFLTVGVRLLLLQRDIVGVYSINDGEFHRVVFNFSTDYYWYVQQDEPNSIFGSIEKRDKNRSASEWDDHILNSGFSLGGGRSVRWFGTGIIGTLFLCCGMIFFAITRNNNKRDPV